MKDYRRENGIKAGGLTGAAEIRLLVCSVLTDVGGMLHSDLLEALTADELVNFFDAASAVEALLKQNFIAAEPRRGEDFYTVTGEGAELSKTLARTLPYSVRETISKTAFEAAAKRHAINGTFTRITQAEKGFKVTLRIKDFGYDAMKLELFAPDKLTAKAMKEAFLASPERFYQKIIDELLNL